ncbi:MAG: lysophospholipid acyltransferase family protein [Thermomicrobiales bacterium]
MKIRGGMRSWIDAPPHWLRRCGNYAAQVVSILLLAIPRPVGYWMADRFGDYFYHRNTNLRANVVDNMRHVMGTGASEIAVQGAVQRAFRMQARNGFDLLRVPRVSLKRLERQVRFDGDWRVIEEALAVGRGVIICTAHYGAFDIMGQFIINRGYAASLLVGRTTSHFVHDSVTYLRQSRGWQIEQVEEPGSVRRVMKALKEGNVAGMVVDRDWSGTGAPVTFFGATTTLPTGHIRMALATGAEIVTVMAPRVEKNRYGFILRPIPLQRTGKTADDVAENMRRMLANIEAVIAHDPGQWVLFRPVWPRREGD